MLKLSATSTYLWPQQQGPLPVAH